MDILLIDPPYVSLKGVATDTGYNIGLTSLAAYLRRAGFDTGVVMGDLIMQPSARKTWLDFEDYAAGQRTYERIVEDPGHSVWRQLGEFVRKTKPRAVGIAYLTPLKNVVDRVAALVKAIDPDIRTILGSSHATFCPDEVLLDPNVDFVIGGEGEVPLAALMTELQRDRPRFDLVPALTYRDQGQVRHNAPPPPIADLDSLPFPARDLVLNGDYAAYRDHYLSSARGCPYTCTFCADRRLWGGQVRRRSVASVITELTELKAKYNVNVADFSDGTFTYDRRYLRQFCLAMARQQLGIAWRCTARYDNVDEESLKLMKQAGCTGLYFGLESGSERLLKIMDKRITVAQVLRASEMVYASGMLSATSVLFGLPDETAQDMKETLRLMRQLKTHLFDVNSYAPLAGTPLWDTMSEAERQAIDWRKVAFKSHDNYFLKHVLRDEFRKYLTEAYHIAGDIQRRTLGGG